MFDRRMQTEIFPYCAAQQIGAVDRDCNTPSDEIRPDDRPLYLWLRDRQRRSDVSATEQPGSGFRARSHLIARKVAAIIAGGGRQSLAKERVRAVEAKTVNPAKPRR
jgi:hypothetical protein